jgi:hypothetical protein
MKSPAVRTAKELEPLDEPKESNDKPSLNKDHTTKTSKPEPKSDSRAMMSNIESEEPREVCDKQGVIENETAADA